MVVVLEVTVQVALPPRPARLSRAALLPVLPEFPDAVETRLRALRVLLADRAGGLAVQINPRHAEPHGVQITGIVDVEPERQSEDFGLDQPVWNILVNTDFERQAAALKHEEAFRPSLAKQREGCVSGVAGGASGHGTAPSVGAGALGERGGGCIEKKVSVFSIQVSGRPPSKARRPFLFGV